MLASCLCFCTLARHTTPHECSRFLSALTWDRATLDFAAPGTRTTSRAGSRCSGRLDNFECSLEVSAGLGSFALRRAGGESYSGAATREDGVPGCSSADDACSRCARIKVSRHLERAELKVSDKSLVSGDRNSSAHHQRSPESHKRSQR